MIVLLVYGEQGDPATLVIHGQDGKTWLSLAEPLGKPASQHLEALIRRTLMLNPSNTPSLSELAYDSRSTL